METHWKFIIENDKELKKLVKRGCKKRPDLAEEVYSDVVLSRVESYVNSYDASRGLTLKQWVFNSLRLAILNYWRDYLRRTLRETMSYEMESENVRPADGRVVEPITESDLSALFAKLQVEDMVRDISDFDWQLLYIRYGLGWTFTEIADYLRSPESTVRVYCNAAMRRVRNGRCRMEEQ